MARIVLSKQLHREVCLLLPLVVFDARRYLVRAMSFTSRMLMSFLTFGSVAIPSVAYPGRVVKLPRYVSEGRVE